jgi:hypothetical protein
LVAVGAAGTLVTSTDGTTWTAQPAIAANSLAAVVYGSQFIAVGTAAATSIGGITWTAVSGTTNDLKAVAARASPRRPCKVSYVAVGAAGAI